MGRLRAALAVGLVFGATALCAVRAQAKDMSFDHYCLGNHVETCFFTADGVITPETPQAFRDYWDVEGSDGFKLYLNSGGGSLEGGIELGQIIREIGLQTYIGDLARAGDSGWPGPGRCASACAYAFLGGNTRQIPEGSVLGFHQFFIAGKPMVGARQSVSMAQNSAATIIQYLVSMGIDARIFGVATQALPKEMIWFGHGEGEDYALVTPTGYGAWAIEPYRDGIIAYSRRRTPTANYDLVSQVSAFCRSGAPRLLFTVDSVPAQMARFHVTVDGAEYQVDPEKVSGRPSDNGGVLEVAIPRQLADGIAAGREIRTWFDFSRADGGEFATGMDLTEMDQRMLRAAFRFCI